MAFVLSPGQAARPDLGCINLVHVRTVIAETPEAARHRRLLMATPAGWHGSCNVGHVSAQDPGCLRKRPSSLARSCPPSVSSRDKTAKNSATFVTLLRVPGVQAACHSADRFVSGVLATAHLEVRT